MHLFANLRITIEEIDMKKQAKKKIKYSTFSNLIYLIKLQFSLKKSSILLIALNIPITVLLSYCSIYIPKLIVQNVIQPEATCWSVLEPVIFISIFVFVLKVTSQIISTINFALLTQYNNSVTDIKNRKCLMTDYENLESPEFRLLMERAAESLWGSNNGAAIEQMVQIFSNLICTLSEIVNRKNGLTVTVVCQNLRRGRFNSDLAVSFVRNNRAVKGKRAAVIRILR